MQKIPFPDNYRRNMNMQNLGKQIWMLKLYLKVEKAKNDIKFDL
jgi:hypothetical protein